MQVEYLMCHVWGMGASLVFVCLIYRPPRISYTENLEFLTNLRDHCSSYRHKVVMGDLNDDLFSNTNDTTFTKKLLKKICTY